MKLNDTNCSTKTVSNLSNYDFSQRDDNKNNTPIPTTATTTAGVCTRRRVAAAAADIDNNNHKYLLDKSTVNQTQGDTLNQIKAMRRLHTRMSSNISCVPPM